jgi:hypothetical protein
MANYLFVELGFPVLLVEPRMVELRGQTVPDVNLHDVQVLLRVWMAARLGRSAELLDLLEHTFKGLTADAAREPLEIRIEAA